MSSNSNNTKIDFEPLFDRVLVLRDEVDEDAPSSIIITSETVEKPCRGVVVAVGDGKPLDNGSSRPMKVAVGDKIIFGKFAGAEFKLSGVNYMLFREEDIIGIFR